MLRSAVAALATAALSVAAAGCGDEPTPVKPAALDGQAFASASVEGYELAPKTNLTLDFEGGRLAAKAGCNTIAGPYTVVKNVLKQTDQAQTQMSCGERIDAQEQWFAGFLSAGAKATLLEHTLTLEGRGVKVVFEHAEPSGPPPVVGTKWTLIEAEPRGAAALPVSGTKPPTLQLNEQNEAVLFGGCNRGGGDAAFADGFVTFGPIITTQMACDPATNKLEQFFLKVLDGKVAAGFSGEGDLSLAKDGDRLLFRAQ